MIPLSAAELSGMQTTQESAMMDECYLMRWSEGTLDEFNLPSASPYTQEVSPTPCGFVFGNSNNRELMQATQVPMTTTMMRLPLDTILDKRDRIKVTKRFGVAESSPKTYSVIGYPKAGSSGLLVGIELVTDGSDS